MLEVGHANKVSDRAGRDNGTIGKCSAGEPGDREDAGRRRLIALRTGQHQSLWTGQVHPGTGRGQIIPGVQLEDHIVIGGLKGCRERGQHARERASLLLGWVGERDGGVQKVGRTHAAPPEGLSPRPRRRQGWATTADGATILASMVMVMVGFLFGVEEKGEMKKGPASCGAFKSRAMNSRVL